MKQFNPSYLLIANPVTLLLAGLLFPLFVPFAVGYGVYKAYNSLKRNSY